MNASANEFRNVDTEVFAQFTFRTTNPVKPKASHRNGFGRRRGKSPQQFNGIHRRRRKKITW